MTGVYERALGDAASDLHPEVYERYDLSSEDDRVCVGRGRMHISRGTHVLPALVAMPRLNLLFPEAGRDVPFSVRTAGFRDEAGHEVLATVREFEFGETRRRFDSLTLWDANADRLLDFLGTGGHLVTELHPRVEAGALVVESGRQWGRLAGRYVELPGPLAASVEVQDRYDDADERFHVHAVVENALAGHVLSYRGAFTEEVDARESVPHDLRPTAGVGRVPPR
ncbi:DUF4166 domain-containing protein [Halomarina rubra]|uniref:DUF4166 domain-containing protein n=1 Tax=Halomarina rubra TaxID=2071873 RepID=A0ABD6AUR8_9EURY|nr:DUF4166 domain-containing protein [Halomarina rubra]